MGYSIEPIFVVFPIICLLIGIVKRKSQEFLSVLAILFFILLYSCSLNGSDYDGYKILYNTIAGGARLRDVHGELGYNLLTYICSKIGIEYQVFRLLLLSFTSVVLFKTVRRISDNFLISLFFLTTMFIIYTVSTYRQYIVMTFSIYWIYKYCIGKHFLAIIGTFFLLFFHSTAIIPLFLLLFFYFVSDDRKSIIFSFLGNNIFMITVICVFIRIGLYFVFKTGVLNSVLSFLFGGHASIEPTLITFGLLSRTVFFVCIVYLFRMVALDDILTKLFFWCYSIGILLYIIFPFELLMGRLMNSVSVYSIILIPNFVYRDLDYELNIDAKTIDSNRGIVFAMLILIAFAILIYQLTQQGGYAPYNNYFLKN